MKKRNTTRALKEPCVYCIINLVTQHLYIGSTVNFQKRISEHLTGFVRNTHYNTYLRRASLKYGIKNFQFFKLENLPENLNRELLMEKEQYYINLLKPEYNLLPQAYTHFGAKRTQNCKDKISKSNVMNIIYQYNLKWDLIRVHFDGVNKAARESGVGASNIKNSLCGISTVAGGYYWLKKKIQE